MSANNEIFIKKINNKWRVIHNDIDCGELEKIGEFDDLETAVNRANEFKRECIDDGFGVEYGLRIESNN